MIPSDALIESALKLPPQERARLIARIIDSLGDDDPASVEASWVAEVERRAEREDSPESFVGLQAVKADVETFLKRR